MHKRTLLTTLSIVALAVAVAATTAASATMERVVSSVRLCIGNLLFHGWHCSVPRTPRAGAYSPEARRDAGSVCCRGMRDRLEGGWEAPPSRAVSAGQTSGRDVVRDSRSFVSRSRRASTFQR